jgi:hypothetical protein
MVLPFLTPEMRIPVIPVFISGHAHCIEAHALPAFRAALLRARRGGWAAIECWPEYCASRLSPARRIAGRSRNEDDPGAMVGVPDPRWVERVHQHGRQCDFDLLDEMTPKQLHRAGNVSGEFLTITVLARPSATRSGATS